MTPEDQHSIAAAARLSAIVDNLADAVVAIDAGRTIIDWNPAAERLFGYSREAIVGLDAGVLVPSTLRDESERLWREAQRGSDGFIRVETERLCRDGTTVDVELTIARVNDAAASLVCSATYRDISERKRTERELADLTTRLKALAIAEGAPDAVPTPRPDDRDHEQHLIEQIVALMREHFDLDVAWRGALPEDELTSRVPVRLPSGELFGTLGAAGSVPAEGLGERETELLHVLAGVLGDQIDRRRLHLAEARAHAERAGLTALLAALDARDRYTGTHSEAVVGLARAAAATLGLGDQEIESVGQVALLHDLGKVGIPDAILQKPGTLTDLEWELMRQHPAIGARIVSMIEPLAHLAPAVRAEHERWDGRGYPDGLAGEEIPIAARITLACDAYHAMISDRPYRLALGREHATDELRRHAGSQFDPAVVKALLSALGD